MNNYHQSAIAFLSKTGVKFSVTYFAFAKHFASDKQERHIFSITLSKGKVRFRFKFGQSSAAGAEKPNEYDVLSCLTKSDPDSFETFCRDFGYDPDSRTAFKIYKAVKREWENVKRLWSDEEIEELQEIN